MSRSVRVSLAATVVLVTIAAASWQPPAARAQAAPQVTRPAEGPPPLPTGTATIRGTIRHPSDEAAGAGLPVALYALSPDGSSGIGGTQADARGGFVFPGVSNDPGIVYLVGTRYAEVPFGERALFAAGQDTLDVDVVLQPVTAETSAVEVVESRVRLDWLGSGLLVGESHHLRNPGGSVVHVASDARSGRTPAFRGRLPAAAESFDDGQDVPGGNRIDRDGDALSFWGPVYPGTQELRYAYALPGPATGSAPDASDASDADGTGDVAIEIPYPQGARQVTVLVRSGGAPLTGKGLVREDEPIDIDGSAYDRYVRGSIAPGGSLALRVPIPEASLDASALAVAHAAYWVDLDDTAMRVTAELTLRVDGDRSLRASPGAPLLRLPMPPGADFLGVSDNARALGIVPDDAGGMAILGPLPAGDTNVGYRFQAPSSPAGARLDLSLTAPTALLDVLVADVGVTVEGDRFHRQRPFRQGTRIYLHRQAYQVAAGEPVPVTFELLDRRGGRPTLAATIGLIGAVLGAAFIAGPLRRGGRREAKPDATREAGELEVARQAIYDAIHDLDHDVETGKLEPEDHARMRVELRQEAVRLMQAERAAPTADGKAAGGAQSPGQASCPGCRARIEASWQFCSHCGHALQERSREAR